MGRGGERESIRKEVGVGMIWQNLSCYPFSVTKCSSLLSLVFVSYLGG